MIWTGSIGDRVRRVIGFGVVAAAVAIMFLPVRTEQFFRPGIDRSPVHACGTAWRAMFFNNDDPVYGCTDAAHPYAWVAAGVAFVGMGIAVRGTNRVWLLSIGIGMLVISLIAWLVMIGQAPGGE